MLGARRRCRCRRRRQQRRALTGVAGALMIGAVVWFSSFARPDANTAVAPLSAVVAVPARQILSDGTVVELKDGAEIAVTYSSTNRRVELRPGEAHFQVMKDAARPFIVAIDSVEVRAVGTSFAVQRGSAQVEVIVTTGRVAVDRVAESVAGRRPGGAQTIATLDAGNRTRVAAAPNLAVPIVEPVSETEMNQRLSWRIPRLEFARTPLAEAIPMINQHSAIKLALGDPALGSVRISGMLRVDSIEPLFKLLEVEHGITVERHGVAEVVLRPRR